MSNLEKKYPMIGCCGIDCGLCPRYFTEGKSRCPGCLGPKFLEIMGQTCSFITCCVKNNNLETCGECKDFPCSKFNSIWFGEDSYDSFVTHKKAVPNLTFIKNKGFEKFTKQQEKRIKILKEMINNFNDGRSNKSPGSSVILSVMWIILFFGARHRAKPETPISGKLSSI